MDPQKDAARTIKEHLPQIHPLQEFKIPFQKLQNLNSSTNFSLKKECQITRYKKDEHEKNVKDIPQLLGKQYTRYLNR